MKILALETSARAVSVAVTENGVVLASAYQNNGLTHSRTLMPLVENVLRGIGLTARDIDLFAVSTGPGSFTGIRIGVAAAKGLAFGAERPAVGVSTLAALARNIAFADGLVVAAMDARRAQIYEATFRAQNGCLARLTPDRAVSLEDLSRELAGETLPIRIVGDGAELCAQYLNAHGVPCRIAPPHIVMQNAVSVALEAETLPESAYLSAQDLRPLYLRPLQAVPLRERLNGISEKRKESAENVRTPCERPEKGASPMNGKGTLHVIEHPLVAHKMSILRDKNTSVKDFRELVSEIGVLITYEATRDLPLTTKTVETPLCTAEVPTIKGKKFAVVPILRAGLGLVDGVLRLVPSARVGHIGMYRDEATLEPHVYFCKMPKDIAERDIMIVDPMLATGGSASAAITEMKGRGCKNIKLMVLLAAPEGVERIQKDHPDVDIYCGALDKGLNEHGYILPGLGDAGDRIFGTK